MRVLLTVLTATITGLCVTLTPAQPATAGIDDQERVATDGAYAIIHYGTEGRRKKYLQIYVHDTKPDGRCAEGWADFDTWPPPGQEGHEHIDPVRAIVCGYNRRGWSPRYRYDAGGKDWWEDTRWRITGLGSVDACSRTRDERDCKQGWPDRNWSDFETYEIR